MDKRQDATIFGKIIGTHTGWDGWDWTEQWTNFRPKNKSCLPRCAVLEIDMKTGMWTAYNAKNNVMKTGGYTVEFHA